MLSTRNVMGLVAAVAWIAVLSGAAAQIVTPLIIPPPPPKAPAATASGATAAATFTTAQAQRGHDLYTRNCADCHGANLNDGEFGGAPLNGSEFKSKYAGNTVDVLFGYMSSAMPPDRPGQLSPQNYADLTAFVLSRNGVQPGANELPSDLDRLSQLNFAP